MSTIPPAARVRQRVSEWVGGLAGREAPAPQLPEVFSSVARHLAGNVGLLESLIKFLSSRISDRGSLPIPSNPHDAVIRLAEDKEDRVLIEILFSLYNTPPEQIGSGGISE